MTRKRIIILLSLTIGLYSCSTVNLKNRAGRDSQLDANSFDKLNGNYSNTSIDTNNYSISLFNHFDYDSTHKRGNLVVNIAHIDEHKISLQLIDNNTVIDSLTLKGNYESGYFKIRREIKTKFIVGPLLWFISERTRYIGMTNSDDLVILDSGGSGFLLLIAFPLLAAGGGEGHNEYERIK